MAKDFDLIEHLWKKLTKKRRLVVPGEFVLDWRPIFDRWLEFRTAYWSRTFLYNFDHEFGRRFLLIAHQWRRFFHENATAEMLEAIRALKYRAPDRVWNHYRVLYMDALSLLPCLVKEGSFATTVGLWIEDAIDEFLNTDDELPLSQLLLQMGLVAKYNCGRVNFDRCMAKLTSMLLESWRVPLAMFECDRNFPVPIEFMPSRPFFLDMVPLIVYSITPTSNTLNLLEKVIPSLAFICDPSVLKGSDRRVKDFFKSFLVCLKARIRMERFRDGRFAVWSEQTPPSARLTDELLDRIMLLLAPLLETMLFGKHFVGQVADFLGQMALIRPSLMLPRLQEQLEGEFDRMCEAHRIHCSLCLANNMLPASLGLGLATEQDCEKFRPWAIDMLPRMLKFISINNDSTSEQAVRFISTFAKNVPMRACSRGKKCCSALCSRTPQLEEFVLTFVETAVDYYSEAANSETGKLTSSWRLLSQLFRVLDHFMYYASADVRQRVGDLLVPKLTHGHFHCWNPKRWEIQMLISYVLFPDGGQWLPALLKYAAKLFREMEEDYDCAGADTYPKDIPLSVYMEIFTVTSLIFCVQPQLLRPHHEPIRALIRGCCKFRSSEIPNTIPKVFSTFIGSFFKHCMTPVDDEEGCQVKNWGKVISTREWQPRYLPDPEEQDLDFRDSVLAEVLVPACALLSRLSAEDTRNLSSEQRLEMRIALALVSAIHESLSNCRFSCGPPDVRFGRHEGVPADISGERMFLLPIKRRILIDGKDIFDLILATVLDVSAHRTDDSWFVERFCAVASQIIGGLQAPFGNRAFKRERFRNVWSHFPRHNDSSTAYLPTGKRFLNAAVRVMSETLSNIHALNFTPSVLTPERWTLLQRLACVHLPCKEVLQPFTFSLLGALASYPGASELLVAPVVSSLTASSTEELEMHPIVPFVRFLSLIPFMSKLSSWTSLIKSIVQLLTRLDKVEMNDLEIWEFKFGLTYKGMSLNWQNPHPELAQVCLELSPVDRVSADDVAAVVEKQLNDTREWLDLLGTLIKCRVKDQLMEKFLQYTIALYDQNSLGHAKMPAELAQQLLQLMCESLNPNLKSLTIRLLEGMADAEAVGLHFARKLVLSPSELPRLCVRDESEAPDVLDPPPIRLAACSDLPQTVFAWTDPPLPSAATVAVAACCSEARFTQLIDTYLQVLRTDGADSGKSLQSGAAAFAVLASLVGPSLLLPGLKGRILTLAASKLEEELNLCLFIIRGLLYGAWRWPGRDLPLLWTFLLPIIDSVLDNGRLAPSSVESLLPHPIDDPRRLTPLFQHLLTRFESAEPDLNRPSTELLAHLLYELLVCNSGWRMTAFRRRYDGVMQSIVEQTPPSPRHTRLVERWLKSSVLMPEEAAWLGPALELEQPIRWLRDLVAPRGDDDEATDGEMPCRLRRLYYLCPVDVSSMKRPRAFFHILADNLKEVLLARGRNFGLNDEASNFANGRIAALTLAAVTRVGQEDEVARVLAPVQEVLVNGAAPPRSLCFALSLLRQLLCRNVVLLSPSTSSSALLICCRLLGSEHQPVVRAAEQALSELLCRGVVSASELLRHLKEAGPGPVPEAHALGALLEAFPHDLAPETAETVARLDAQLGRDRSLRLFVEKTIRNFLRAHQDAWEEKWKAQLPLATRDLLLRLSGSASYFS